MNHHSVTSSKLIKLLPFCLLAHTSATSAFNMAYVEVNSNFFGNVACYIRSDNQQPFFGAAAIFAGSINGNNPNAPQILFNSNVDAVLHSAQVTNLQAKGIKVLM